MNIGPVRPGEIVARVLVQSNHVRWSDKAVHPRAFLLSEGAVDLSVHRRSHMSFDEAVHYAMKAVGPRGKARFYGWAVLSAEDAGEQGRQVLASPDENPYHATIKLPPAAATDRNIQKLHARRLAEASRWVEPPQGFPAYVEA